MVPPSDRDDWVGLSADAVAADVASAWVVLPSCGAVVTFSGHARDHSPGRPEVTGLSYEAYESQVEPRLAAIAGEMRRRWAPLGRIALLHRVGPLDVSDVAVVVAVSAPHRDAAFEAARFGIDTLKETVPIWKRETWADGTDWGLEAQHVTTAESAR
ncbi:MAG: molybdenum cofactor biosynthesis protein MoaE [Acidimicrobiales bacterium]